MRNKAATPETPVAPRRFRPYPEYKDSGVEWLGEIPGQWEVKKLSWLTECLDGRRIPLNAEERGRMQGKYPYWGANSIVDHVDRWLFDEELVLVGEDGAPFFDRDRPVAFRVSGKIWVNNHAHVLRPYREIEPKFLPHALNCVDYRAFIDGTTRDKLTQGDMNGIPVQCPAVEEQCVIAAFLDRETAKIDALIEKKEKLIELLKEKRTALITQAVTKGLDPNVPMKDSGIEWLGEIPAHWEVKRLKFLGSTRLSNVDKKSTVGEESVRLCNYVDVYYNERIRRDLEFMKATATPEQVRRFALREGDVLITKDSESWVDIAVPAVVAEDLDRVLCGYHLAHIRPGLACQGAFLGYTFAAIGPRDQFRVAANGITRFGLGRDEIRSGTFGVPPLQEQRAITTFLDRETAKIDALTEKVHTAVALLREYRTALISAAVTGKIDVREEVA